MIKYAKVLDKETKKVDIALGDDIQIYEKLGFTPQDVEQSDIDGQWYLTGYAPMKTDEQKAQEERERIQELFMTRSNFFDATIKAFGTDEDDLLIAINGTMTPMSLDNTEQKIALNNYKNALNFYRKHPLFTILSNVPIKISEALTITITSEQWDKFFDETDKKNTNAYKELLPKESINTKEVNEIKIL